VLKVTAEASWAVRGRKLIPVFAPEERRGKVWEQGAALIHVVK
jgi:hypothetical protein